MMVVMRRYTYQGYEVVNFTRFVENVWYEEQFFAGRDSWLSFCSPFPLDLGAHCMYPMSCSFSSCTI